jgi:hypothetical protein
VCPIHAGSGEPSPFWHDNAEPPEAVGQLQNPAAYPAPNQAPQQKPKPKERGLRKLLRDIFGGN